jgi:hypothetical protein
MEIRDQVPGRSRGPALENSGSTFCRPVEIAEQSGSNSLRHLQSNFVGNLRHVFVAAAGQVHDHQ